MYRGKVIDARTNSTYRGDIASRRGGVAIISCCSYAIGNDTPSLIACPMSTVCM